MRDAFELTKNEVAASRIFCLMARAINKAGADAKLAKQTVVELRGQSSNSGEIVQEFDSILLLYSEGQSLIPIVGNKNLNNPLEASTRRLSTWIATANRSAVSFIGRNSHLLIML